jgi:hypothetical protein
MESLALEAHRHRSVRRPTAFFVRGKPITYESVERYYKRRGTTIEAVIAQNTSYQEQEAGLIEVDSMVPLAASVYRKPLILSQRSDMPQAGKGEGRRNRHAVLNSINKSRDFARHYLGLKRSSDTSTTLAEPTEYTEPNFSNVRAGYVRIT